VNDDWRVRVMLTEPNETGELVDKVALGAFERDLEGSLHDRVIVSHDEGEIFLYAGTRKQAEGAEEAVRSLAQQHGWEAQFELSHWHPTAEEWEDPDKPLPATDAERAAEHAEMVAREREDEEQKGYPDYEVRVQCHSHHDAVALAEELRRQGLPFIQRWKFLLLGALDEDHASALAERLRGLAPPGSTVTVEGTIRSVTANEPRSRFSIFRGIGG
jgi:hypothetical protein